RAAGAVGPDRKARSDRTASAVDSRYSCLAGRLKAPCWCTLWDGSAAKRASPDNSTVARQTVQPGTPQSRLAERERSRQLSAQTWIVRAPARYRTATARLHWLHRRRQTSHRRRLPEHEICCSQTVQNKDLHSSR